MKRMSGETSDAVRSTVPPGLAILHVSACLVTLRVPDPKSVFFWTADLVLSRVGKLFRVATNMFVSVLSIVIRQR